MIKKILIANRGEIAVRIIKTCKKLQIASVAIYSDIDQNSMFVELADEAYALHGASSEATYLNIKKIIDIAERSNCDAIHPGYGFLSENAEFAKAVNAAGIKFIGPQPDAILQMGLKSTAKKLMQTAGVSVLPGYNDDDNAEEKLTTEAKRIGYPILIKAAAGGGGKGMRIVRNSVELPEAIAGAKREALKSFSNDKLILEKFLEQPRHIEVQVLGDNFGNMVYLFERDCSMQRRYQKVIEEAPAPNLSEQLRKKLGEEAIKAAKAINYHGVGTIEFLLDGQNFYFMEMNTRLQVEHPVTEMITSLDLVELQILVANGKNLPFKQSDLRIKGAAIEVRIYAEDTQNDFLPACGDIEYLCLANNEETRVDTGVRIGDKVDIHYDPMLAKVIVWGENRDIAIIKMVTALEHSYLVGVKNNIQFLMSCLQTKEFQAGKVTTNFIGKNYQTLIDILTTPDAAVLAAGIFHNFYAKNNDANLTFCQDDYQDIWHCKNNFRLNQSNTFRAIIHSQSVDNHQMPAKICRMSIERLETSKQCSACNLAIEFDGKHYNITALNFDATQQQLIFKYTDVVDKNTTSVNCRIFLSNNQITVLYHGHSYIFDLQKFSNAKVQTAHAGALNAPMPGTIIAVNVNAGAKVATGDVLIILEAMKMEHAIKAPREGTVTSINFKQGEQVTEGAELLIME